MSIMPKIPVGCNPPETCFECRYTDCIRTDLKVTKEETTMIRDLLPYPDRTGKFKNSKKIKETVTV
jgi:hypothetical protein